MNEINENLGKIKDNVRDNMKKLVERDESIQKIHSEAENANQRAADFRTNAARIREEMAAERRKTMMIIGGIAAVCLGAVWYSFK